MNGGNNGTSNTNSSSGPLNTKLVVSNLHYEIAVKDLIAIFGQVGTLVREPHIKFDRSGRSTGIAYITYETPAEATRAKKQFDGILAKGQPMTIVYDTAPMAPRNPRRVASAPGSLMDRIQKRPLLERLGGDLPSGPKNTPPVDASNRPGPTRNRNRGRGSERPVRVRKEPKTAEQLDKELEDFMVDDNQGGASTTVQQPSAADSDVEMAT